MAAKTAESTLTRSLRALDWSYGELSRLISFSGPPGDSSPSQRVIATLPRTSDGPPVQVDDLVQHLIDLCTRVVADGEALHRNHKGDAAATFTTNLASIMRTLVNITFLFDCAKYPQHLRLPTIVVTSDKLNTLILRLSTSWLLRLTSQDYSSNETGSILTNLVTLLHNYVSHEFGQDRKPFCSLLFAQPQLSAFLTALVNVVVGKVGTDLVLRNQMQQVCVEFWNAIVNWNIVEESQFSRMRAVFVRHERLKDLLEYLLRKVHRKDDESIYFLTLLFDSEDFITRFIDEQALTSFRTKYLDFTVSGLNALLTAMDITNNPTVQQLEHLASIGAHVKGRKLLLGDFCRPLLDLVVLFVGKFEKLIERAEVLAAAGDAEENAEYTSLKKLFGHFFRLYGAMHEKQCLFLNHLVDQFSGSRNLSKLRCHLETFLLKTVSNDSVNGLLSDNSVVDTEDVDRFFFFVEAFKKLETGLATRTSGVAPQRSPHTLLSRSVVDRFKSLSASGYTLPLPVACSDTFLRAFEARTSLKGQTQGANGKSVSDGAIAAVATSTGMPAAAHNGDNGDVNGAAALQVSLPQPGQNKRKGPHGEESNRVAAEAQTDRGAGDHDRAKTNEDQDSDMLDDPDSHGAGGDKKRRKAVSGSALPAASLKAVSPAHTSVSRPTAVHVSDDDETYEDLSEPEFIDPAEWESDSDQDCYSTLSSSTRNWHFSAKDVSESAQTRTRPVDAAAPVEHKDPAIVAGSTESTDREHLRQKVASMRIKKLPASVSSPIRSAGNLESHDALKLGQRATSSKPSATDVVIIEGDRASDSGPGGEARQNKKASQQPHRTHQPDVHASAVTAAAQPSTANLKPSTTIHSSANLKTPVAATLPGLSRGLNLHATVYKDKMQAAPLMLLASGQQASAPGAKASTRPGGLDSKQRKTLSGGKTHIAISNFIYQSYLQRRMRGIVQQPVQRDAALLDAASRLMQQQTTMTGARGTVRTQGLNAQTMNHLYQAPHHPQMPVKQTQPVQGHQPQRMTASRLLCLYRKVPTTALNQYQIPTTALHQYHTSVGVLGASVTAGARHLAGTAMPVVATAGQIQALDLINRLSNVTKQQAQANAIASLTSNAMSTSLAASTARPALDLRGAVSNGTLLSPPLSAPLAAAAASLAGGTSAALATLSAAPQEKGAEAPHVIDLTLSPKSAGSPAEMQGKDSTG